MLSHASRKVTDFTRAMPESIKFDTTIDTITAYKQYLNTKPWLASNYLRIPSRKPSFIITTMTTTPNKSDLPVYDFSTTPEQRAAEQAKQDAAIASSKELQLESSSRMHHVPRCTSKVPRKLPRNQAKQLRDKMHQQLQR